MRKMPFLIPLHSQCKNGSACTWHHRPRESLAATIVLTLSYLAAFHPRAYSLRPSGVVHAGHTGVGSPLMSSRVLFAEGEEVCGFRVSTTRSSCAAAKAIAASADGRLLSHDP